jgi:hypothetical protein
MHSAIKKPPDRVVKAGVIKEAEIEAGKAVGVINPQAVTVV